MSGIVNMATNMTSNTGSIGSSASTIQNTTMSAYPFSTTTTQSANQIRPSNNRTSFVNANSVINNGINTQNEHSSLDSSNTSLPSSLNSAGAVSVDHNVNSFINSLLSENDAGTLTKDTLGHLIKEFSNLNVQNVPDIDTNMQLNDTQRHIRFNDDGSEEEKRNIIPNSSSNYRTPPPTNIPQTATSPQTWGGFSPINPPERIITSIINNNNTNFKDFDGKSYDIDLAKNWLKKFNYAANTCHWEDAQRIETFKMHLKGPAKNWFKQLEDADKAQWSKVYSAFKKKFCKPDQSFLSEYFIIRQRKDESALNYFDRINVAAKRAGIEYKSGRESIKNHLLQFYSTLHDQNLAIQLRLTACNDISSLAEILEIHEQGKRHVNRATGSNHSSSQFNKSDSNSFKNRSHGKNDINQNAKDGV